MRHLKAAIIALLSIATASITANAQLVINLYDSGSSAVCSITGSLNTSNAVAGSYMNGANGYGMNATTNSLYAGISFATYNSYSLSTDDESSWGTTYAYKIAASTSSATPFIITGGNIAISTTYVSGSSMNAGFTYNDTSFYDDFGMTSKTFTYTIGNGTASETISVVIDTVVVPEPSSYALSGGIAVLGLVALRRRMRNRAA